MRTINVLINKGEFLIDALKREGYNEIQSNVILAKTLTGIGATHCELFQAKRHSIIIEPNVPVIIGKTEREDGLLPVYALCTKSEIKKYLNNKSITYKKLITTPESFKNIKEAAQELNINIFKEYFCLFDECEKITQDVDYRPRISQPINDFFKFDRKALVSATPLQMRHPALREQGFELWKITPTFDYRKDMSLIVTRSFNRTVMQQLRELSRNSKCVCLFYNTTQGINEMINFLLSHNVIKEDEYKVFCSKESVKKLKGCDFKRSYENLDLPLAKFNFFTCRFFSAVDIFTTTKPDVLLLSNCNIPHSIVDPFTEAIQAQGRFRNKYEDGNTYNLLTVISNTNEEMEIKTDEEIDSTIRQYEVTHCSLMERYSEATTDTDKKAILKDMERVNYALLLDEEKHLNYFSVDNLYNEERVKRYYTSAINLRNAYLATGHFNINFTDDTKGVGEDDKMYMRKASKKDLWKKIVSHLERLRQLQATEPDYDMDAQTEILKEFEDAEYIINAYNTIGKAGIEQADYQKGKMDKMIKSYGEQQAKEKRFEASVLIDIWREFQPEIERKEYIPIKSIRERLKVIFKAHGIFFKEYGIKAGTEKVYFTLTDHTIKDYYDESCLSNAKGGAYRLIAMKPELVEKISKLI
ncbi:hypothetical protein [Odoribacter sp. Z80]|uniref:hypothetical protein n=1 Tax=Odoribacter sp. Z80 TaxID=2304575 RepID=UPI00137B5B6D|nr:hypothetical protein [Odoribacter sp. Z80]NCE72491.1 hypothetical protein [Odoribacter sp. Z80]